MTAPNPPRKWLIRSVAPHQWEVCVLHWFHLPGHVYVHARTFVGPGAWDAAHTYVQRVDANNYRSAAA